LFSSRTSRLGSLPEDLILKKLEFSAGDLSSTDVEDIISIMLRQRKSLDTDYLIREASRKDTYALLKKIIERIEERTWEE
jgi:hypothetical protein